MLIGNRSVLHKSPGRFLAGTVACTDSSGWCKPGMLRAAAYPALAGIPVGYYRGSWFLPKTAGAMSSAYNARVGVSASGLAVGGVTAIGSASISFPVADAAGQLIASGSGSASIAFSTNTPLLTASIGGAGSASFSLSASGAPGAKASGGGSASFSISMSASILPADDTPPARSGAASFAITGSLVPYAVGHMSGSTANTSVLTVDSIAAAVLAAALTTPIYADIRRVNSVPVAGDGEVGSEWGPA